MKTERMRQAVREIGRHVIPDDWTRRAEILARAREEAATVKMPRRFAHPLRRLLLAALLLLISTSAVYAVIQVTRPMGDSGLAGVQQAGFVSDLNLIQTVGDVAVQLNWAYIDEGRAVVNYQTYLVRGDGTLQPADADAPFAARLIDRGERLPDLTPNRYETASVPQPVTMAFYLPDTTDLSALPETLDLRFEIVFTEPPRSRTALERLLPWMQGSPQGYVGVSAVERLGSDATEAVAEAPTGDATQEAAAEFGSITTFGDGGGTDSTPPPERLPLPPGVGPFAFDFSLPLLHAVTVTPNLTITGADIPMTLEMVSVAPSKTDLRLCFTPPQPNWWLVEATLQLGETVATPASTESSPRAGTDQTCTDLHFEMYAQPPTRLTLTVEAIEHQPYETAELQEAQRQFAARGIPMQLEIRPDGTAGIYTWPSGLEEARAALIELGYRIEGHWVFRLELPGAD